MKDHTYTVHFEYFKDGDLEGYQAIVPALPGCVTWGATLEEAREMATDAIRCYIESLVSDGAPIPEDLDKAKVVHVETVTVPV